MGEGGGGWGRVGEDRIGRSPMEERTAADHGLFFLCPSALYGSIFALHPIPII